MTDVQPSIGLSSIDDDHLVTYRPVSRIAVASAVAGFSSVLALISPVLWFIPIVAILLAVVALVRISRHEAMWGVSFALAGIVLACLFGSWSATRLLTRQHIMFAHAQEFADDWFEQIRHGHLKEAHQLTLPYYERASAGVNLASYYRESEEQLSIFEAYFTQSPLAEMKRAGEDAEYRFEGTDRATTVGRSDHLTLRYLFIPQDPQGALPIHITLARERWESDEAAWYVFGVTGTDP
jgi:hypothetical protein